MSKSKEYYDKKYFSWQKNIGEVGGWASLIKFEKFIKPTDNIIDFGCGGGYLLKNIKCREKIGIEINPTARKQAKENGIKTVTSANNIDNNWADVIISNNVLEHVENPLIELKILYKKLKKGGKIIFVVPCESIYLKYTHNDINQHLYSWSPLALGNLFAKVGFKIYECRPFFHKWPPYYEMVSKLFGRKIFHLLCFVYGRMSADITQIRIIGIK
jgi:SAM-dependent methyltransferase